MHPFNKPFIHSINHASIQQIMHPSTNYYLIVGLNTGRYLEGRLQRFPVGGVLQYHQTAMCRHEASLAIGQSNHMTFQ